jgi:hypothetical protein
MLVHDQTATVKELIDKTVEYAETNIHLMKMKVVNKGSSITSAFLAYLIIAVFVLVLILMLTIGAALWLGSMLGASHYGFFIMAGFYLILILVLYKVRGKWLKMPIANSLLQSLYK